VLFSYQLLDLYIYIKDGYVFFKISFLHQLVTYSFFLFFWLVMNRPHFNFQSWIDMCKGYEYQISNSYCFQKKKPYKSIVKWQRKWLPFFSFHSQAHYLLTFLLQRQIASVRNRFSRYQISLRVCCFEISAFCFCKTEVNCECSPHLILFYVIGCLFRLHLLIK
jgi:hypothetical protein